MSVWPRSLSGQLLLAIALSLLLGQAISGVLLFNAAEQRREQAAVAALALRLVASQDADRQTGAAARANEPNRHSNGPHITRFNLERGAAPPARSADHPEQGLSAQLGEILEAQGYQGSPPQVISRPPISDPRVLQRLATGHWKPSWALPGSRLLLATSHSADGSWVTARIILPPRDPGAVRALLMQTLLLFVLLLGMVALLLRRITRPLALLTQRMERFAGTRDGGQPLAPQGPDDISSLITAHNALEARIASLLDEKNVMLGAIGHDLKTPLAALRVRIESVENDTERGKMAATIEDIVRSLDDILSLARVGRPTDPLEPVELSALVAQVAEEFEDLGEPVTFNAPERIVLPLRATWLRRALRNLVSNALRYGQAARIDLVRDELWIEVRVQDDGPGIPDHEIARMVEPFTRGDPSRNSVTGGAGLGLALARAIAEQHGGTLKLTNRRAADGRIAGLDAIIRLPV